jgi:hypothetical protein
MSGKSLTNQKLAGFVVTLGAARVGQSPIAADR